MSFQEQKLPCIGQQAPAFKGDSTKGVIHFPIDYKGRWVILFNHISDFRPICTTEYVMLSSMERQFKKLNCQLLGVSVDSLPCHIAWLKLIQNSIRTPDNKEVHIQIPLIEDLNTTISQKYGMMSYDNDQIKPIRTLFIIDPEGCIRTVMQYPKGVGRNFEEIYRILLGLMISEKFSVGLPANWQLGDDVLLPMSKVIDNEIDGESPRFIREGSSVLTPDEKIDLSKKGVKSHEWFLNTIALSEEEISKQLFDQNKEDEAE